MDGEGGGRRRRTPAPPAPSPPPAGPARAAELLPPVLRDEPGRPRLDVPSLVFHVSFLEALREYQAEGRHLELPSALLADPAEFARYVAALRAGVTRPGELDRYLGSVGAAPEPPEADDVTHEGDDVPHEGGHVPQTTLWWVRGDEYLGRVNIRHRLTEELRREGGHIGYEVRPGARGLGHATAMLAAALPIAASLGIELAHMDCDVDNPASRRVIEKNGGRLDRVDGETLYFLVPTSPGAP